MMVRAAELPNRSLTAARNTCAVANALGTRDELLRHQVLATPATARTPDPDLAGSDLAIATALSASIHRVPGHHQAVALTAGAETRAGAVGTGHLLGWLTVVSTCQTSSASSGDSSR